jgi:hypothetical protein
MGVEKVVTPVRRSVRIRKSSRTPDQKIAALLEENSFAYVPNPASIFYFKYFFFFV